MPISELVLFRIVPVTWSRWDCWCHCFRSCLCLCPLWFFIWLFLCPLPLIFSVFMSYPWHTALYHESDLCISRNETVRPHSQFLHSCICERFTYSQDRSAYLTAAKKADRSWEYINFSQIHQCGNWETEHYKADLEITRLRNAQVISGNT